MQKAKEAGKASKKAKEEPNLHHEVIFENILIRVPVSTLMRCSCVCKLWYKSILHDPHFSAAFLGHQSKKDHPFVFYYLNVLKYVYASSKLPIRNYIFRLEEKKINVSCPGLNRLFLRKKFISQCSGSSRIELVGNCNGLVCFSESSGAILIVNPSTGELLTIFNPPIAYDHGGGCIFCCYGFGYDSLTHEYKVVLIVRSTVTAVKNSMFKCLVFTLGTNSWRETSTTIPSSITTTSFYKSAIFCGGALFWRTKSLSSSSSSSSSDNDMLLLSFDLHDDKFQIIRLPAECASSSLLEQQYQIIDPLLEFKGSPCVARLEKTILGGGRNCTSTSSDDQNTSYCYKVNLHILKEYNKVGRRNEQVWIKETFDVPPISFAYKTSPAAPCFIGFHTSRDPPNRIMSSSDGRVFLYSSNGRQLIEIYDLQKKHNYIVKCDRYPAIFFKNKHSDVYDPIDYHLNGGHIENFMSMLTFIPKGGGAAPPKLDHDEFVSILNDKQRTLPVVGYLSVQHRESTYHYLF